MRRLTFVRHLIVIPVSTVLFVPAVLAQFTGTVDFTSKEQRIDGFGVAATFARPNFIQSAVPPVPAQVADQLFNPRTGAGITMLRLGMDEIVPTAPASSGPAAASGIEIVTTPPSSCAVTPDYDGWDGSAGGEVWLGQQAVKYGVKRFYADSWSAPAYMKTTNTIQGGGAICGGPGATTQNNCTVMGDCRAAYANYLVEFLRDYRQAGIPVTDFDWINEPTENVSYASMTMTTDQVIDFMHVLGPIVRDARLGVNINCCDSATWTGTTGAVGYTSAIVADTATPSADSFVAAYTGHEYGAVATTPLPTNGKRSWMTEWGPQSPLAYNPTWDQTFAGTLNNTFNGMYVANDISNAISQGKVSGYIWWYADSTGATGAMIQMSSASGATSFVVTRRLFALGHFARFVHPGAFQVPISTSSPSLNATAFVNPDGTRVINVVNNDTVAETLDLGFDARSSGWTPASFVTDENETIAPTAAATVSGTTLTATFAPRSLTTITLAPPVVAGEVRLTLTPTLMREGDGTYLATVKLANAGSGTARNVQLNRAALGPLAGSTLPTAPLPYPIGDIAPGSFALVTVNFPAGQTPSHVAETFAGTYTEVSKGMGQGNQGGVLHFSSLCSADLSGLAVGAESGSQPCSTSQGQNQQGNDNSQGQQ